MTGIVNVIVGMWLLPVTLFILIPLAMLVAWMVYRGVRPMLVSSRRIEDVQGERIDESILVS